MHSPYNPKIVELKQVINNIKIQQQALNQIENMINPNVKEKSAIEQNLNKLTFRKDELNEELAENENLSEAIKMKYAIMLLMNFGNIERAF